MAVLLGGCDAGSRDEQPAYGPALHVVATYPADGQGTNTITDAGTACDAPTADCAVPTDVAIELRFDRFLLPTSGLGAGLRLFSGDPDSNGVSLSAHYDLIERVLVFRSSAKLQPSTLYTAEIVPAKDPSQGFWAFDRAPLEAGPVPFRFSFVTGAGPAATSPAPTTIDDCVSLGQPAGPLNGCTGCHQTPPAVAARDPESSVLAYPPMGLALTGWGLAHTAIKRVAHETETGNSALDPGLESGPRFGVQMNIVDPGAPEKSYLMYKLLRRPDNYALADQERCPTQFHPPVSDGACLAPDELELTRLGDWFVQGDPMPKSGAQSTPFSRDDLVRVANWISAGAACDVP